MMQAILVVRIGARAGIWFNLKAATSGFHKPAVV